MSLGRRDLYVGGRYQRGIFIRTITKIVGDDVYWSDDSGAGRCTKQVFIKKCEGFVSGDQSIRPPIRRAEPLTSQGNLAQIATMLSVLLRQHTAIACAIQPVLPRLESNDRQNVSVNMLHNLTVIEEWRKKIESIIGHAGIRPGRRIMVSLLREADLDVSLIHQRHELISQSVAPFFGRLGENERLSATQALSDHSSSLTHLRSELATILS
jgi:hypothetical protein